MQVKCALCILLSAMNDFLRLMSDWAGLPLLWAGCRKHMIGRTESKLQPILIFSRPGIARGYSANTVN